MKKITFALFYLIATFVSAQNLIVNPDFQANGGGLDGWMHTPWDMNTNLWTNTVDDGTGDFYALLKGENGVIYQKVAVTASSQYTCTMVFRFITTRQTSGYGYAIETDTPLTPPDVATITNGSSAFSPFCTSNGGAWTAFGNTDNTGTPNPTAPYTQTYTFNTPEGATYAYICIGTKGAVSQLQINSVSLVYDGPALSTKDSEKPLLTVYPNPATNEVTIKNIQGAFLYNIYNVSGNLLKTEANQISESINISDLSAGMYFLEIADKNNIKSTVRIMKQ